MQDVGSIPAASTRKQSTRKDRAMITYLFKCQICGKAEEKEFDTPVEFNDTNTPECSGTSENKHDKVKMEKIAWRERLI